MTLELAMAMLVLMLLAAEADALPGKVVFPPPIDQFKLGMKQADVTAALDSLPVCGSSAELLPVTGLTLGPWCFRPHFQPGGGGFRGFVLLFSSLEDTRATLKRKWGRHREYGTSWYWVNPSAKPRLQAWLAGVHEPAQLHYRTYTPLSELLGAGPRLAFEKLAIVGARRTALSEAYGPALRCDSPIMCSITLPRVEVGDELRVIMTLMGDDAIGWDLDIPPVDDVVALLERKWGPRIPVKDRENEWVFPRRKDLMLTKREEDFSLICSQTPFH
jgi:hypothetical protein